MISSFRLIYHPPHMRRIRIRGKDQIACVRCLCNAIVLGILTIVCVSWAIGYRYRNDSATIRQAQAAIRGARPTFTTVTGGDTEALTSVPEAAD